MKSLQCIVAVTMFMFYLALALANESEESAFFFGDKIVDAADASFTHDHRPWKTNHNHHQHTEHRSYGSEVYLHIRDYDADAAGYLVVPDDLLPAFAHGDTTVTPSAEWEDFVPPNYMYAGRMEYLLGYMPGENNFPEGFDSRRRYHSQTDVVMYCGNKRLSYNVEDYKDFPVVADMEQAMEQESNYVIIMTELFWADMDSPDLLTQAEFMRCLWNVTRVEILFDYWHGNNEPDMYLTRFDMVAGGAPPHIDDFEPTFAWESGWLGPEDDIKIQVSSFLFTDLDPVCRFGEKTYELTVDDMFVDGAGKGYVVCKPPKRFIPVGEGRMAVDLDVCWAPFLCSEAVEFYYLAQVRAFSVTPAGGPVNGGTIITVQSAGNRKVKFASNFDWSCRFTAEVGYLTTPASMVDDYSVVCTTPEESTPRISEVAVKLSQGHDIAESNDLVQGLFVYYNATIEAMYPKTGPTVGGTVVTLTGSNFPDLHGELQCSFGGVLTQAMYLSRNSVACVSPPLPSFLREDFTPYGVTVPVEVSLNGLQWEEEKLEFRYMMDETFLGDPGSFLFAWGKNNDGQLGLGDTNTRWSPHKLKFSDLHNEGVNQGAAGAAHTLVVSHKGEVWSWGQNEHGQLGIGTRHASVSTPRRVEGALKGVNVTQVAAGKYHSAALSSDGRVFVWGDNIYGQLGVGSYEDRHTPVEVPKDSLFNQTVTSVVLGGYFSTALLRDGSVASWGRNDVGQLGCGDDVSRSTPTRVHLPEYVWIWDKQVPQHLACGDTHCLMIMDSEFIYSWGGNNLGQLGLGPRVLGNKLAPERILSFKKRSPQHRPVQLFAAGFWSMVLLADGSVMSWGENTAGQLGYLEKDDERHSHPEAVHLAYLLKEGYVVHHVAGGEYHATALMEKGETNVLASWGTGYDGETGLGDAATHLYPEPMELENSAWKDVKQVVSGGHHSIAILDTCPPTDGWEVTFGDSLAVLSCPPGLYGLQKRMCHRGGVWGEVDVTDCKHGKWPETLAGKKAYDLFGCEANSQALTGPLTRSCGFDGEWGEVDHAECRWRQCMEGEWGPTQPGEWEVMNCPGGADGTMKRYCRFDGNWDPIIANCTAFEMQCQADGAWPVTGHPSGETAADITVRLECPGNYTGTRTRVCTKEGQWKKERNDTCERGCADGFILYDDGCSPCPAGTFKEGEDNKCYSCPLGMYQSLAGQDHCLRCPVNYYAPSTAATTCLHCPAGQWAPSTRSSKCEGTPMPRQMPQFMADFSLECEKVLSDDVDCSHLPSAGLLSWGHYKQWASSWERILMRVKWENGNETMDMSVITDLQEKRRIVHTVQNGEESCHDLESADILNHPISFAEIYGRQLPTLQWVYEGNVHKLPQAPPEDDDEWTTQVDPSMHETEDALKEEEGTGTEDPVRTYHMWEYTPVQHQHHHHLQNLESSRIYFESQSFATVKAIEITLKDFPLDATGRKYDVMMRGKLVELRHNNQFTTNDVSKMEFKGCKGRLEDRY